MPQKPRLLLLDAGAVFEALRAEAWETLVAAYDIVIPSIVVRVEAQFYVDRGGRRVELDLAAEVNAGRVREVEMTAAELLAVGQRFTLDFRERIDEGELEGLAHLLANPDEDIRFVSGDGPAIEAVAMLDPNCRVIALAEALELCGQTKALRHQFERKFTREHVKEGQVRRIQGRGLV